MADVGVYVPYEVVFPDGPRDFGAFRKLIDSLSRTEALFWCAHLNQIVSDPKNRDTHTVQGAIAARFLLPSQLELVNRWAAADRRERGTVAVFFRAQLLELASWLVMMARDHPQDGSTFSDEGTRARFAEAALLVGDAWAERVFRNRMTSTERSQARRDNMGAFRRAIFSAAGAQRVARMIARGDFIYDDSFVRTVPDFDTTFRSATGVSLEEYQACSVLLAQLSLVDGHDPGMVEMRVFDPGKTATELPSAASVAFLRYIARVSQTPDELSASLAKYDPRGTLRWMTEFDHLPLRDRPVLRSRRGTAIVIDTHFMAEKLTVGPLFELVRVSKRGSANTLFGAFGTRVERYVQELLRATLPDVPFLLPRVVANPNAALVDGGEVEIGDAACLLGPQAVCLIEVKAVFIADKPSLDLDPAKYVEAVLHKYAANPQSGSAERRMGVTQLANAIRRLATGELTWDYAELGDMMTVYPVLVVYDDLIGGPGHTELLSEAFLDALQVATDFQLPTINLGKLRVRPLVVATVSDLESLQSSLGSRSLQQILDDYIGSGMRESFHDHLARHADRLSLRESQFVIDRAEAVVRRVKHFFAK